MLTSSVSSVFIRGYFSAFVSCNSCLSWFLSSLGCGSGCAMSSAFIRGQILLARLRLCRAVLLAILFTSHAAAIYAQAQEADAKLREQASATMRKAAEYYRNKVALHGGYVYYYSPDLKLRHGEGPATATQIWVQPPGTPTVGLAYLAAYK